MDAAANSTPSNAPISSVVGLSTSSILTFNIIDVNIAQIILSVSIIIAIRLERIENQYMQRFMNILLATLYLETLLICLYAYIRHGLVHIYLAMFVWELYKIVRLFISLSLCYPIIVFTNKQTKLHLVFFSILSIIIVGAIVKLTKTKPETLSGYNNVAFFFIFLYTLYQYYQLKSQMHNEGNGVYIKGLNSLIAIEMILIFLNSLLIILFYSGVRHMQQTLRLSLTMVQYLKIYMIMSMFASLNVTVEPRFHL